MMRVLTYVAVSVMHFSAASIVFNKSAVKSHPSWRVLKSFECGDSAANRIIGGYNAVLGQFPWMVRLGYVSPYEDDIDWMCGGALISDRHVVTAAHCITSGSEEYQLTSVLLGEHNTETDPDCELGICAPKVQYRRLKNATQHKSFNNPPFHNDIAILEMVEPVQLNDYVAPICLPQDDEQLAGVYVGEMVTAAGWGKMNMTTEERAKILQVVRLPIVEPSTCNLFGNEFRLSESEICAGAQYNKDACGGDSGGPLMKVFDTPDGPKYVLVGVVSFGPTICGIKKPGVYSSVPHFLQWILDYIEKNPK